MRAAESMRAVVAAPIDPAKRSHRAYSSGICHHPSAA
jgi:hypothetical protein